MCFNLFMYFLKNDMKKLSLHHMLIVFDSKSSFLPGLCLGPARDLKRSQTPRLLTLPLTTNPGSAPGSYPKMKCTQICIRVWCRSGLTEGGLGAA
jgi:hypothetical protein